MALALAAAAMAVRRRSLRWSPSPIDGASWIVHGGKRWFSGKPAKDESGAGLDEVMGILHSSAGTAKPLEQLKALAVEPTRYIAYGARQLGPAELLPASTLMAGYDTVITQLKPGESGSPTPALALYFTSAVSMLCNRLSRRMQLLVLRYVRHRHITLGRVIHGLRGNGVLRTVHGTEQDPQAVLDSFTYRSLPLASNDLTSTNPTPAQRLVDDVECQISRALITVMNTLPEAVDVTWLMEVARHAEASVLVEDALYGTPEFARVEKDKECKLSPMELRVMISNFYASEMYRDRQDVAHAMERYFHKRIDLSSTGTWEIQAPVAIENSRKIKPRRKGSSSVLKLEPPFTDSAHRSIAGGSTIPPALRALADLQVGGGEEEQQFKVLVHLSQDFLQDEIQRVVQASTKKQPSASHSKWSLTAPLPITPGASKKCSSLARGPISLLLDGATDDSPALSAAGAGPGVPVDVVVADEKLSPVDGTLPGSLGADEMRRAASTAGPAGWEAPLNVDDVDCRCAQDQGPTASQFDRASTRIAQVGCTVPCVCANFVFQIKNEGKKSKHSVSCT